MNRKNPSTGSLDGLLNALYSPDATLTLEDGEIIEGVNFGASKYQRAK